jgi:hypothetical protein
VPSTSFARPRTILLVLALSALVAAGCAVMNSRGNLQQGTATTHVMIDYPSPSIINRRALPQDVRTLTDRAQLYGEIMSTPPVLERIARRAGVPVSELSGLARLTALVPIALKQPDSELRASQIVASHATYRLELQADPLRPILGIYAAAPTAAEAQRLADATVLGTQDYIRDLAAREGFPVDQLPQLRQLEPARGVAVGGRAKPLIAILTFVVAFGILAAVLLGALLLRSRRRGPTTHASRGIRALDDWPRTNRLLPWTIAGFLAVLWLTPFDQIQLTMHTPIDMKLDRLLLPLVFIVWIISFAAGKVAAPRLRLTGIHVAVGAFVAVAFLSVVLDAQYLNHTMELNLSLKKLPLLVSYVFVFLIVSTAIRPTEVQAFLKLTLGLSLIVGLGIIWEYRFKTNVFTFFAQKALAGPIQLETAGDGPAIDSLGRRGIVGPTAVGLEAVTVLSLALPIVIVGLMSSRGRQRLLYALAACVLVAATMATGRKSALLAPVSVVLTLAYFRRRELLSLAPVGLVVAVAVGTLSSGAIHSLLDQFLRSDRSSVATTSDRTADYDAIRPDVWTHILFGRGYGSYDHNTYRILDSEILGRLVETGVVGLLAFLMIGISVVLCGRRVIAQRTSPYANSALIGAAAAVCFITAATLYDVTAFAHSTYLFLSIAGLTSVVVSRDAQPPPSAPDGPPVLEVVPDRVEEPVPASPSRHGALV